MPSLLSLISGNIYWVTRCRGMVSSNKVGPQTPRQRHGPGVTASIEKKILQNSKIKHLGEKPGDFGEIKVTTHSIFDKKGQKFWVWKRMRFTDITLPMK